MLVEQEGEWGESFGFFELFVGGYEVNNIVISVSYELLKNRANLLLVT